MGAFLCRAMQASQQRQMTTLISCPDMRYSGKCVSLETSRSISTDLHIYHPPFWDVIRVVHNEGGIKRMLWKQVSKSCTSMNLCISSSANFRMNCQNLHDSDHRHNKFFFTSPLLDSRFFWKRILKAGDLVKNLFYYDSYHVSFVKYWFW